ncbi:IclR family transcriptional regulator [Variovorax sp. J22R133]|uniref:IclR family transcriptional regulator n=1 Tax=Variovorax brevis TaxID=3053503 RepID=UPI0025782374|nr:IclR family transcriptional regulator [Variovorax sp. J22R133]MDM0117973.1 IclR family transcriptional regulator [Variovorax sp. J22R133]
MTEPNEPASTAAAESSGVAVLDRAFALLAAFGPTDERLTLTELSIRTGLYKSTVLRLLAALEHGGYIRKLPDGQYTVGPQPLRLAAIYQRSFQVGDVIEPLLKQLSAASGETASFYVRQNRMRIALFRVEPSRSVRASVRVGQEYPIEQGASGKILLAFTPPVAPEYSGIRENHWAASYGERDPETASVAAPVFGVTGELSGSLALSAPRVRLTPPDAMYAACRQVLEAAREATQTLGGNASRFAQSLERLSIEQFRTHPES